MRSFVLKIYLFKFLVAVNLIGIIFTLFFQSKGLNPFEISLLIGVWSATQLLLEVPMGVVADKYSRRNVLVVGVLIMAIGYLCWLQDGIIFYILGMVAWGVKNALTSGTMEAFIYDELKALNSEEKYGTISARSESVSQIGYMISSVVGGFLAIYSFSLVIILSILGLILSSIVLLTIKSVRPVESTGETKYFTILKQALKEIKSNRSILFIIVFISLTFGISGSADEFWPLIFNTIGGNPAIAGALVAIEFGAFALAGYSFTYYEKLKIKNSGLFLIIVSGILFMTFGLNASFNLIFLVVIASFLLKLALIELDTKLQHAIKSDQRATILSLKSLTFEIIYILSLGMFGFISSIMGTTSIIYIWGGLIILLTILFSMILRKIG